MHTAQQLTDETFAITIGGAAASLDDLLPDFDDGDRLGIVVGAPHGVLGASLLVLAAVHRFYGPWRARGEEFWIYPDFFAFHVGTAFGDHGALDLWPPHKEVVVAPDATAVLQAINDRGVTRLLVPEDGATAGVDVEPEALASARARLRSAFAYSHTGRTADADVEIAGDAFTDGCVEDVLRPHARIARLESGRHGAIVRSHFDDVAQPVRDAIASDRARLVRGGRTVESYRRIAVEDALERLVPAAAI